jgi:hypothetical protein
MSSYSILNSRKQKPWITLLVGIFLILSASIYSRFDPGIREVDAIRSLQSSRIVWRTEIYFWLGTFSQVAFLIGVAFVIFGLIRLLASAK